MIKTLFATIILALAFTSVQASNITISGSFASANGLFNYRPIYVRLTNMYEPEPVRTFAVPPLWQVFWFTGVYPGNRYSIIPYAKGMTFEPAVVFLDEPQDDVVGITFYYQGQ